MKKLLLFVIACTLGLFGTVNAQETITIGNEEEAIRTYSVPFDLYNGYGVCQQLYTADEIGKTAGAIESLALKFVGPTDSDMQTPANQDQVVVDFEIYVENTTMTTLSAFQVVETGDLYFSGKQPMESDAWTTFEFSNSFEYDGTNLLITIYCVGDKYEMKTDNNYYPFYIYSTNDVQCLSASPQDKPIAGVSFGGLNENSGKNILQLTFAAGEGGEEEGGDDLASEFSFDFEDGTLDGWRVFQGQYATGDNWQLADGKGKEGSKGIYSASTVLLTFGAGEYTPQNYVVTTDSYAITETSELSWWMGNESVYYDPTGDAYQVVISEDGTTFTPIWSGDGAGANENTISLAEYAGKTLYLGFYHYIPGSWGDGEIRLDNIVLTAGEGGGEEPTPEPEPVAPAAPVVEATVTETTVTLTWEAVENATYYNIYTPSTFAENILGLEETTYTFEGLTAGTEYCFEVSAGNDVDESDATEICATTEEAEQGGTDEPGEIYIVEVGADKSPNTYNNYNVPVYDYNAYSVSQQIYTAADLGAVGDIHSIAFKLGNQTSAVTRQYEVYLSITELSSYGNYYFVAVTEADKVFDGDVEISGTVDSWFTINFDKEFPYSGGNIVLTVYDKTGVALPNGYHTFYKYATAGMNALNKKGHSPYDMSNMGTGGGFYYVNQIQLGMEVDPTPTAPQGLAATATSSSEIALTWGAVVVAESYNIYAGTELVAANVEGTSYTVEGLTPATEYCFTVTAVNELGESAASTEACATTKMLAPATPANLSVASVGEMSVSLTWDAVATAESYKVYQGETVVATNVTATEYTVEGLASETEYCFTVAAVNNGGESAKSEQACGTTLEFTGCYVNFTLTDSYGDGWNYNTLTVSYGTASQTLTLSSGKTVTHIVPIPQNAVVTLTYTVVGSYSYPVENGFVVAYESGKEILRVDEGSLSATKTFDAFTVDCGPTVPDAPVVTAANTTSTTIVLAMEAYGAEKYNIYQGEELVASVTEKTYTVEGLEANTDYCFSVTAENSLGESEATEVCAKTKMYAPAAPANLTAETTGYFSIALTWEASATAESYNIYQGENLVASVTETTYIVEGLTHNTEYCFTVKAVNNGGESVASESACDTTEEYDGCFVNFTLSDQWNDGWDGDYLVVSYGTVTEQLECPKQLSPKTYTLPIPQGAEVTATYTKTSSYPQEKGIVITYESGKEILNIAQGTLTETTSWEFVVDCTPEAPGIATVSAEATSDETVVLTMEAVGAESFNIYVGEELVATSTEKVYTVEGLNPETEYCFTVEAVNEVGTSEELSEAACATTYKKGTAVVQIGEGTDSYVQTSPVNEFYSNSISQTVYTAEEIGFGAGIIKSISYNQYSGYSNTRNLSVFMKNVGEDVNLTSAWETLTEDLLVYDSTFTFGTSGWTEIKLQKDFVYEGGNLLVCVLDKTGNYAYNYDMFYTYLTGSTIRSIYAGYSQTIDPYNINVAKNGLYNNNYNAVAPQVKFVIEPVAPTFADYRLESVATSWGNTAYTYDEENANTVVSIDEDGIVSEVTYNEDDQIASVIASYEDVDEEGNPVEVIVSGVEYEYDENGVWTSYTETVQGWFGGTVVTETALNYDAEGRLVSLTSEELVRTIAYNEAGLISEVMEGSVVVEEGDEEEGEEEGDDNGIAPLSETEIEYSSKITFEYDAEGRLIKKNYYSYDAYETMEFYWGESEVYTYDENGNCVKKESYEVTEENELNSFPYSVEEYIYDLTISNEDVYSFEYPHFAFVNYVEPSYVNILLKEKSYYSYYDEDAEEVLSHSYEVTAYNYNPAVLSLPEKPMNLTAEVMSATEVELAWAGFPDAETFTLYSADTVFAEGLVDPYYTVENLEMGVEYCFAVMATNSVGNSEVSETVCVTIELPAAPANLVATATSDTEIALTWDEIPGIWSYNVYKVVETAEETTYELLGEAWWVNFTVSELTAETEYSFVVRSVSNVGESANSNVATAKTLEAPKAPAAPVVEAEATSDTTIVLTWATVEGALSYNVYQGEDSIANVTDTTYTVTGLTADTEYTFTVTAINEVGESEASNEAKAKTNAAPVVPTVPAAPVVEVVEVTETTIVFAWAPVEGALSYNVYQGEDSIANVTDTTYTVTGLTANTEYCFTVTAVNEVGESAASEEVCATTKPDAIAENAAAFNIYPNPVADRLFIETEANVEEVTIYTLTGVMIYSEVDFNNNSINVSELNGGVYIMKVRTENGEAVRRFIKK